MDTRGYIELMHDKLNASYYRIARMLGVTDTTMDNYRKAKRQARDENALKIADALNISRAEVLLDLDVERAESDEVKKVREWIRKVVKNSAAAVLVLSVFSEVSIYVHCILC